MNIIQETTKDCERDDCCLTLSAGASTCMGWTPTYDKKGNRTDEGDPNTHSSQLRCSACRREWYVSSQYDKTTVTLVE